MAQFESNTAEIKNSGLQVAFVAAQTRGGVFDPEKYFREHSISYPFLLDEDRSITKAYGVYQWVGFDGINIAHPATFLIDEKGIARYIHVGDTQWERAPLEDVLNAAANPRRTRRRGA
jgi:peroxiredoxin